MIATLTIIYYKKRFIPFALLAMMLHRLPLYLNKKISFWKLMGSGKNGTFDKKPDWQQWGILIIRNDKLEIKNLKTQKSGSVLKTLYGSFIAQWIRLFNCQTVTYLLTPIEGHGLWDGKKVFGELPSKSDYEGKIAVLTRATIRISKLKNFWKNVAPIAAQISTAKGFITSYGIGEVPWIKQATFSIWNSKDDMVNFAYKTQAHTEVINKTKQERWYSEDMFVRFKIIDCIGAINRNIHIKGKS